MQCRGDCSYGTKTDRARQSYRRVGSRREGGLAAALHFTHTHIYTRKHTYTSYCCYCRLLLVWAWSARSQLKQHTQACCNPIGPSAHFLQLILTRSKGGGAFESFMRGGWPLNRLSLKLNLKVHPPLTLFTACFRQTVHSGHSVSSKPELTPANPRGGCLTQSSNPWKQLGDVRMTERAIYLALPHSCIQGQSSTHQSSQG